MGIFALVVAWVMVTAALCNIGGVVYVWFRDPDRRWAR